jgi:cell division transport system permease protein
LCTTFAKSQHLALLPRSAKFWLQSTSVNLKAYCPINANAVSLGPINHLTLNTSKHASYFYAIFGIALVLFVIGTAAVILNEAINISNNFKEGLNVELVLKDSLNSNQLAETQKALQLKPYVKSARYISKDEAAKILQKDLGQNFLDILGYNPLYASYSLNLKKDYTNAESFAQLKADLLKVSGVASINVQSGILEALDKNIKNATLVVLVIVAALLIFAISLIFNTIRLVMFSSRFTIKTMQLFGATKWFIIRPFLSRSIFNGLLSSIIASLLIGAGIFYFDRTLPELGLQRDLYTFALLSAGLAAFGILISFICTLIAVLHYLRLKVEDLY